MKLIIKKTTKRIRTDGNEFGASYEDVHNIVFIQVKDNELQKTLEEEQRKSKGKASFIVVEGEIVNVPLVELKKDWVVCYESFLGNWNGMEQKNMTETELKEYMNKYYDDWSICNGGEKSCGDCPFKK